MSTIYSKIKADFIGARKKRIQLNVSLLSTVIGEMDNEASRAKTGSKEVSDEVAIKVLKKFSSNLEEVINLSKNDIVRDGDPEIEKIIIDSYLPKQLTEDELRAAIKTSGFTSMKDIMAFLKANHAGLYDGKMASQIAKEFA
ncbi:aspartyl-tRNA amidotransferase subunit B [Sinorhizobium phage phiN3]|uniref:Aspartyl-tRNA amidotransferase subunit B n=1 Tax=Sinorhizobium phage phiN3 TaxID=1647405 RepID=A0A0F6YP80_9CAUD|nr:tRNA amidotransferase [Sinorhizobium phage phiN3]AKF13109.1 aspartyl-tRNA amidotransferase subunit B [Sinorhizobium phage phiM19]AKF13479.1 aspartyl-tRNA amidotransferase subunit B [Sinorhizobium phage phiN3]